MTVSPENEQVPPKEPVDQRSRERLVYVLEARTSGGGDLARVRTVLRAVLDGKWIILACVAVSLALAIAYYRQATPWYQADAVLLPVDSGGNSGLSAQVSSITGMLGLKGLGTSGAGAESAAVLRSRDFAMRFIEVEKISSALESRMPRGFFGTGLMAGTRRPDPQDVTSYFVNNVLSISEDRRTGLQRLSITWVEPQLAARWANALVAQLNAQLRASALSDAESNVHYLRQEMASASQVSVQQALAKLMQDQLEKELLARGNVQFAFKVIDIARTPTGPVRPQLLRVLFIAVALGAIVALLVVMFRARALFDG